MSEFSVPFQRISRVWMLLFLLLSFTLSFALEHFIVPGRGKATFYTIFMTGCAIKTAQPRLRDWTVLAYLLLYSTLHIAMIFLAPLDDDYPGGLLLPAAIADYTIFYLIYERVGKTGGLAVKD